MANLLFGLAHLLSWVAHIVSHCLGRLNFLADQDARIALGMPLRRPGKVLTICNGVLCFADVGCKVDAARQLLTDALLADGSSAAATLGHVEYLQYAECVARWLKYEGHAEAAGDVVNQVYGTLQKRQVPNPVLDELRKV